MKKTKSLGSRLLACGVLFGLAAELPADEMITVGAGNVVGVYYAASSAMAKIYNRKRQEYHQWLVPVASQGSVENINSVLAGTHPFGLAQANLIDRAMQGKEPWTEAPKTNLQAVLGLYTEAFTVVVAEDSEIVRFADLKGKRINIGAPGSSDQASARQILAQAGLRAEDVHIREDSSAKSVDLMEEGKIDAYFYTVGHPDLSVREATSAKRRARILNLDQSLIDHYVAANPLLKPFTISTVFYPGLADRKPVATVGMRVVLFTREGMDDETVYRLVKEVMTNLDLFRRQQPALASLTAKEMADVPVIPLHPGARRYFREAGLLP